MKQRMLAIAVLGLVGLCVSGPAVAAEEEVLQVWTRLPRLDIVVDMFNQKMEAEGRALRAEVTYLGAPGEARNKFVTAVASGLPPDILSSDIVQWPEFAEKGMLLPLDRYRERFHLEEVPPSVIDGGAWRGQLYGLPVIPDISVLFYWTRHFEEAGLDTSGPETWDEFAEAAWLLTRPESDRYGWHMSIPWGYGWYLFTFLPFVWGNDGELFSPDGERVVIASHNPGSALQAVEFWADQVARGVNADNHPQGLGFWEMQAAMRIDGSNVVNGLLDLERTTGEEWGVVPIPRPSGGNHSSFLGGDAIGIPVGAQHVEEAVEFISFAMSRTAQEGLAAAGNVPPSLAYMTNPYFLDEPRFQTVAMALPVARVVKTLYLETIFEPFTSNLMQAFNGEISPVVALESMEAEINSLIGSP